MSLSSFEDFVKAISKLSPEELKQMGQQLDAIGREEGFIDMPNESDSEFQARMQQAAAEVRAEFGEEEWQEAIKTITGDKISGGEVDKPNEKQNNTDVGPASDEE